MLMRIFVASIILIAIIVGVCVPFLSRDTLIKLMTFRDFFELTLPILAFGALIKYLWQSRDHHPCCSHKNISQGE